MSAGSHPSRRGAFASGLVLVTLAATSLTGCFDDPTEVVIAVDTDAVPFQDFTQITFNVSQSGQSVANVMPLPATFGVTRGGPSTEFDVTVSLETMPGFSNQGRQDLPFVTRKASHVKFVQDHMKVLFLPLFKVCACVVGTTPSTNCIHALDPECRDLTAPTLPDFDEGNIPHLP